MPTIYENLVVLGGVIEIWNENSLMHNKPARQSQIGNEVDMILLNGICKSASLSALTGRVNFAKTLVAGRPPTPALVTLYEAIAKHEGDMQIDDQIRGALETIQEYVRSSKSRRVDCMRVLVPIFFLMVRWKVVGLMLLLCFANSVERRSSWSS